ncbi:MAG: hypothetical protein HFG05_02750 [Oscillibacter sp.]|nr:hypothetical protein [Oscillibacter sp.]
MKITAKIIRRGAVVLTLAAAVLAAAYQASYPIKLNMLTLPKQIAAFDGRFDDAGNLPEVTVYGGAGLGNREYYLIEIGGELGSVTLKRSLTGRYRIECLRYGTGGLRDAIVESGGKKYLLLGGRDAAARIARIAVSIGGLSYDLENDGPGDHFLLCTEIDRRVEDNHINRDGVRFYSAEGEDITELYDLRGGGI